MVVAIVMHNLPLSFVVYTGIRSMLPYLRKDVVIIARNTIKADIIKIHKRKRRKIQCLLQESPGRISLTFNLWTFIRKYEVCERLSREKTKVYRACEPSEFECKNGLKQDVPTRWNSTFLILESALYFRLAFPHLKISDSNFRRCPSGDEWDRVEKLTKFLIIFYKITCVFFWNKVSHS
ncbi:hypothetical protein SCA6_019284 [Theobroma cacao]